ncbi:MAG: peptide-methionine (S)-S-oxide reductase MsrA [Defluviicoccus sp.]|nr:peptide-methionine (S)-S-oxide reductase MsrA [Defluviicoccus sp.]
MRLSRIAKGTAGALLSASLLMGAGAAASAATAVATFAGGCFWCVESDFDKVPGVIETVSGYTGGTVENPTYEAVTQGGTGHFEAVRITYDPAKVTYDRLLDVFWHSVDPTDAGGQFCDRGESYRTAVFFHSPEQKRAAVSSKKAINESGTLKGSIVTPILMAKAFYPAEDYHQGYYMKDPLRYRFYRFGCGRDNRLREVWGKDALRGIEKK